MYVYYIKKDRQRQRQRVERELAMCNRVRMFLPYPELTHFEKLLLYI